MFLNKKSEKLILVIFLGLNLGAKQARNTRGVTLITCSAYESEKVRDDQVSAEIHPPVVLVPSLTSGSFCGI